MPVIVRDIDRDAATIIMVDSNLQRENILPSEWYYFRTLERAGENMVSLGGYEKTTSSPIIAALQKVEIKKFPLFSSFCIHLDSYDNIV